MKGSPKILLTAGKKGILWKIDRTTAKFLGLCSPWFSRMSLPASISRPPRHLSCGYLPTPIRRPQTLMPAQSGGHKLGRIELLFQKTICIIFPLDPDLRHLTGRHGGNFESPESAATVDG